MSYPTIHQLEIFLAVARAGSFTQATEELLLSRAAVTLQVKQVDPAARVMKFGDGGFRPAGRGRRAGRPSDFTGGTSDRHSAKSSGPRRSHGNRTEPQRKGAYVPARMTEYLESQLPGRVMRPASAR